MGTASATNPHPGKGRKPTEESSRRAMAINRTKFDTGNKGEGGAVK